MVAPEASRGVTMFFQNRKIKRNTAQIIQTKCCYAEKYKTEAPQWKALSTWSMCICSKYFFGICVLQSVFFNTLYFFGICVLRCVFIQSIFLEFVFFKVYFSMPYICNFSPCTQRWQRSSWNSSFTPIAFKLDFIQIKDGRDSRMEVWMEVWIEEMEEMEVWKYG